MNDMLVEAKQYLSEKFKNWDIKILSLDKPELYILSNDKWFNIIFEGIGNKPVMFYGNRGETASEITFEITSRLGDEIAQSIQIIAG